MLAKVILHYDVILQCFNENAWIYSIEHLTLLNWERPMAFLSAIGLMETNIIFHPPKYGSSTTPLTAAF